MKVKVFVCVLILLLLSGCGEPTPDQVLIDNFNNNRSDFETLVTMMQSETELLYTVAHTHVYPEDTLVSSERLQEYRQLLDDLDLHSVAQTGDNSIMFTAWVSGGFPDDGEYKGYVYFPHGLPDRLKPRVRSELDSLEWHPDYSVDGYLKIDENWYVWFSA